MEYRIQNFWFWGVNNRRVILFKRKLFLKFSLLWLLFDGINKIVFIVLKVVVKFIRNNKKRF